MTKHYSPARRDNYRDAEKRRKLRDSQRKQARALKGTSAGGVEVNRQQLRAAIEGPLLDLARAREYAMRTVEIPAPRPASDFCPTCGGSLRHHPAWVTFSERCTSDWHDTTTERKRVRDEGGRA